MTYEINETHDPNLRSWVESANDPNSDFPIQNLPFGEFKLNRNPGSCVGVRIGDSVLDLTSCSVDDLLDWDLLCGRDQGSGKDVDSFLTRDDFYSLNVLASQPNEFLKRLRQNLVNLLAEKANAKIREDIGRHLIPMSDA